MTGHPGPAVDTGHVEPVPRRVRARLGTSTVLDTVDARYVWEWPYYPQFYVPIGDVEPTALVDEDRLERTGQGLARRLGLRVDGHERAGAAWHYVQSDLEGVAGTVRFDWAAMDAWFEEDEEVVVHPRNPYVRVDTLRSSRTVRVEHEGVLLAASSSPVLLIETGLPTRYYLDPADVRLEALRPSDTVTTCPYKGRTAQWWSLRRPDGTAGDDVAWRYDVTTREAAGITGLVALYDELVDVTLDGVAQSPPRTHFARRPSMSRRRP